MWHRCPIMQHESCTLIMHVEWHYRRTADDRFDQYKANSPFCKVRRSTPQGVGDHQSGKLPFEPTELKRLAQTDSSVASRPDAQHDSACSHSASSGACNPESVNCCVLHGTSWQSADQATRGRDASS